MMLLNTIRSDHKRHRMLISMVLALIFLMQILLPAVPAFAADGGKKLTANYQDAQGRRYAVTVSYSAEAGIPSDSALSVVPISRADDHYYRYALPAASLLDTPFENGDGIQLLDISIVSKKDAAVEYQPAAGAKVDVKIQLAEAVENEIGVVHFGNTAEVIDSELDDKGRTVSFETSGFSIFAIVKYTYDNQPETDPTALDQYPLYLSVTTANKNTYYVGGTVVQSGTRLSRTNANDTAGAAAYRFQKVDGTDATYYMYLDNGSETRSYLKLTKNDRVAFVSSASDATPFTASPCGSDYPNRFWFSFSQDNATYYFNLRGSDSGKGFGGSTSGPPSDKGSMILFERTLPTNDTMLLDGKSYGLGVITSASKAAMLTTEAASSIVIRPEYLDTRANPLVESNRVVVSVDGDIQFFTFHVQEKGIYYITASVGGATKYLRVSRGAASFVDVPDEYSLFYVTEGTGDYAGKLRIRSKESQEYLALVNSSTTKGFIGRSAVSSNCYFALCVPSFLTEDDFVPYCATKVSVSDREAVHNGSQVVVYTRVWNDTAKQYEFYAINHDGSLVHCYDEGGTIRWIGAQVNTMLWDFTEYYYWNSTSPNYYYELQNTYSGKYIAPQYHTGQILSDNTIGINLNGRRYGDYYTTILAWDDYRYDYAALSTNGNRTRITAVPMTNALDFYFAIMDEPTPGIFHELDTVDNAPYGISMKLVNFHGAKYDNNNRDRSQTEVMGEGSEVYVAKFPTLNLVTTDLNADGYPVATRTNRSLEDLFGDATDVNHLFLESIYNESGYFEYDCTQTYATLLENGDFRVYNELGTVETSSPSQGHGWFMPYNDISPDVVSSYTNVTGVNNAALSPDDPRLNETLYGIPRAEAQYHFGMQMEASFIQSKDGLDAFGHDIIFEFAGDDDMWLYVDNELVLDLGGVHSALIGKINFRTGDVTIPDMEAENGGLRQTTLRAIFESNYRARYPEKTDGEVEAYLDDIFVPGTTVFKNYSSHTMKMFYMERGAGASNLHMRFNLTTATNGQLLLSKEISGTDKQDYTSMKFPYQLFYYDTQYNEFRPVLRTETTVDGETQYTYTGAVYVNYENTNIPVEYLAEYNGYQGVYFIKPGEVADIQFPDDQTIYIIKEIRVDAEIYDEVYANDEPLTGTSAGTGFMDYETEPEVIGERKLVTFTNHVDDEALRTLQLTKELYDVNGDRLTVADDDTGFRFRVYIGEGSDSDGLGYYRMDKYYVKDPSGSYCCYDYTTQQFSPINKTNYDDLTSEELANCTFTTSPSGAIDKIPADFTVEIRNLLIDTKFKIEERESDIPKGYDLIEYVRGGDGSYIVEEGDSVNSGTIRARQNPEIIIRNHRGWGLTVEKVWSDADFVDSHDNLYFAVYNNGQLVPNTIRRMNTEITQTNTVAETSLYYYFDVLAPGAQFSDYTVKEVALTEPVIVDENGYVTSCGSITVLGGDVSLVNGAVPTQTGTHTIFSYNVSYEQGTPTGPGRNVRTDTVTNTRPGIRLVKLDGSGDPLPGAQFTLADSTGGSFNAVFNSGDDGMITYAYPEEGVTYILTETKTPNGYAAIIDSITFSVSQGELTVSGQESGAVTVSQPDAAGTITIEIKNYTTDISVIKIDSVTEAPIAGVHFAIYRQVEGKNGLMRDYYPLVDYTDLVTDANGELRGFDSSIPPGVYYLSETQVPSGYYPLDHDLIFAKDAKGSVTVLSSGDEDMLRQEMISETEISYTLLIPNRKIIHTMTLSPQTLVADFGLGIEYDVTDNNYLVPEDSAYSYIGVTAAENYDEIGTKAAPALLAQAGAPVSGSFGTLTLAADGTAVYEINTMSFTGEDTFCLVAHATRIDGDDADLYVYEMLTYIPATTVYYEDNFVSDSNYINGIEGTQTGRSFGTWSKVTSGEAATRQAADLASSSTANIFGYDPAYTDFTTYSNNAAHKVSVSAVNAPNAGGQWPTMQFDFAGTGFDLISVTGCDTGIFYVRVFQLVDDGAGNLQQGTRVKNVTVDTYYGYNYGRIYLDQDGNPTLSATEQPLFDATQSIIDTGDGAHLLAASGKFITDLPTYLDAAGSPSDTAHYYDPEGEITAAVYYKDPISGDVLSAEEAAGNEAQYTPNYAYAYAEGWILNSSADTSLYQIPVIKVSGLEYGAYRAVIEPRFTTYYGHYETAGGYNYFDLYVDAFRIYDPAGDGNEGTITSTVIQEAYSYSDEAYECFTTLKKVVVGADTLGSYTDEEETVNEGAVLVDGGILLTSERLSDYRKFGPNNELYLEKGMAVAFEVCAGAIPADVQIQAKKISDSNPALKVLYYDSSRKLAENTVEIRSATDLSYSLLDLIGSDNVSWEKINGSETVYKSGLIVVINDGAEGSLLSITNLKWTFHTAGARYKIQRSAQKTTISASSAGHVNELFTLSKRDLRAQAVTESPAVYEDGKVTMTITTGNEVTHLVVTDQFGETIDEDLLQIAFAEIGNEERAWQVTVDESEPGVHLYMIRGADEEIVSGEAVRLTITIPDDTQEIGDQQEPDPETHPGSGTNTPSDTGNHGRNGATIVSIEVLIAKLLDLIRSIFAQFGLKVK